MSHSSLPTMPPFAPVAPTSRADASLIPTDVLDALPPAPAPLPAWAASTIRTTPIGGQTPPAEGRLPTPDLPPAPPMNLLTAMGLSAPGMPHLAVPPSPTVAPTPAPALAPAMAPAPARAPANELEDSLTDDDLVLMAHIAATDGAHFCQPTDREGVIMPRSLVGTLVERLEQARAAQRMPTRKHGTGHHPSQEEILARVESLVANAFYEAFAAVGGTPSLSVMHAVFRESATAARMDLLLRQLREILPE